MLAAASVVASATPASAPWGSWIEARVDAAEVLRAELVGRERRPIKFTPIASDPWVGVERRLRITRACLEVLAAAEPPVIVVALTRSARVLDDLDVLVAVPGMRVGVSPSSSVCATPALAPSPSSSR
jgi:DNA repair photolyase